MTHNKNNKVLDVTDFTPLDAPGGRRRFPLPAGYLALGLLAAGSALVLAYLFLARAVIFRLDPADADIRVSGISFHIGGNYLLMPGDHLVTAAAPGYFPLERRISVSDQATQEIELALDALPGKLHLVSELDGIQVHIDGEPAGAAPGIIEGIGRGPHTIGFQKHRYFPLQTEIEIEGLGRTQSMTVHLEPAWGEMNFSSVPAGADLFIDGRLIGQTPLATEVLETGSQLRLSAPGYKTWRREVSVKAGTTQTHPPIELSVADGTLLIRSTPTGAGITINEEFRGTAPLSVALSPLKEHRVEWFLEGHEKAARRVRVEPEEQSTLAVKLKPIIGRIRLSIDPADATVLVDGQDYGHGSQTLALTATEHAVTVQKAGFEPRTIRVTPRPGQAQSLDIELLTVQQAYWATRPPTITSPAGAQLKLFRVNAAFTLGAPRREPGRRANEAQRNVALERPFYLGTHEVTNAQFRSWKAEHSSTAIRGHTLDMDFQPAVKVTWQDAALYCNWLSSREGLPLFYAVENGLVTDFNLESHGYRLPTEAEWAWAARIGADGQPAVFPWGTDLYPPVELAENYADRSAAKLLSFSLSNYDDGYPVAATVGSFRPNDKGLYDLGGNVAEWVNDFYDIRPSRGEPETDPAGPRTGTRHVIRGASWAMGSRSELRLSYRDAGADGRLDLGFRIARYVDKAGVNQ